ncbi:MAG: protein-disulfide reductase DsbD N-terminal domain-containing protein, partial [Rhodocyclaceae bacterium]|nr:protein-disulfide reductase DsbD N-terminal domain-containing protein [Rhodocyclaceae bacterium]
MNRLLNHLLPLLAIIGLVAQALAASPLHPLEAYKMQARSLDPQTIEVVFDIHEDYYLYKANFRFKSNVPEVVFGTPDLPPGKAKHDEFFGDVEIYRDELRFRLPVQAGATPAFQLTVVAQGC